MIFRYDEEWKEMNLLYKEFERFYHEIALQCDLSDSAFLILYSLCELGEGCTQKEICGNCSLSKQTVNSSMQKLERDGLLAAKKGRGRDIHLSLTEAGQRLVKKSILPVIELEHAVFEEMGEEERRELLRLTRKYLSLLQKRGKDIQPAARGEG